MLHKLLLCVQHTDGQRSTYVMGGVVGVSASSFPMYVGCASAMVCSMGVHPATLLVLYKGVLPDLPLFTQLRTWSACKPIGSFDSTRKVHTSYVSICCSRDGSHMHHAQGVGRVWHGSQGRSTAVFGLVVSCASCKQAFSPSEPFGPQCALQVARQPSHHTKAIAIPDRRVPATGPVVQCMAVSMAVS